MHRICPMLLEPLTMLTDTIKPKHRESKPTLNEHAFTCRELIPEPHLTEVSGIPVISHRHEAWGSITICSFSFFETHGNVTGAKGLLGCDCWPGSGLWEVSTALPRTCCSSLHNSVWHQQLWLDTLIFTKVYKAATSRHQTFPIQRGTESSLKRILPTCVI